MAIYDAMQVIRPNVRTYCIGQCASMGAWLLAAGAKGKRYALPNSRIMIHQPFGGAGGQAEDIKLQAAEIVKLKVRMTELLAHHTGQSFDRVKDDIDRDKYMSAEEALKYGMVDEILKAPKAKGEE